MKKKLNNRFTVCVIMYCSCSLFNVFVFKRCFRVVYCLVKGAARKHHSCLTGTMFYLFLFWKVSSRK